MAKSERPQMQRPLQPLNVGTTAYPCKDSSMNPLDLFNPEKRRKGIILLFLVAAYLFGWASGCLVKGVHGQELPDLWAHVYHRSRLQILQAKATVTGTIVDATAGKRKDGLRHEADGDCHGWLRLDPGQENFLNAGNLGEEKGNLVFEVVCMFRVSQADAVSACKGYKNAILVPPVGSHVKMTGSWVKDMNHARWL